MPHQGPCLLETAYLQSEEESERKCRNVALKTSYQLILHRIDAKKF